MSFQLVNFCGRICHPPIVQWRCDYWILPNRLTCDWMHRATAMGWRGCKVLAHVDLAAFPWSIRSVSRRVSWMWQVGGRWSMSYRDVGAQTVIAVSGRLALTLRAEAPWHDDIRMDRRAADAILVCMWPAGRRNSLLETAFETSSLATRIFWERIPCALAGSKGPGQCRCCPSQLERQDFPWMDSLACWGLSWLRLRSMQVGRRRRVLIDFQNSLPFWSRNRMDFYFARKHVMYIASLTMS